MSLISLPAEVLHEICRCIQRINDREEHGVREFRSLVKCCRHLSILLTPYLYQDIRLEPRTIFLLLETLLRNPNLGLGIKEMRIIPQLVGSRNGLDLGKAYTMLQRADLPKACTRYLHPNDPQNINLLLTELLLLQTPRLERLFLDLSILGSKAAFFDRKRWKQGTRLFPAQTLPQLNRLSIYFSENFHWIEKRDVVAQIQHLITLSEPSSLWLEVEHPFNYKYAKLLLPSVEKLHVVTGGMSREVFTNLLRTCPNAQFIEYRNCVGRIGTFEMQEPDIKLRDIIEILRSHRPTLETLKISFGDDSNSDGLYEGVLPDLRPFKQLRDLCLDGEALKRVRDYEYPDDLSGLSDSWHNEYPETHGGNPEKRCGVSPSLFMSLLPSSLEKLQVDRADDSFYQELGSLVRRKTSGFTNIKTVILRDFEANVDDKLMTLRTDLTAVSIKLSWNLRYPGETAQWKPIGLRRGDTEHLDSDWEDEASVGS